MNKLIFSFLFFSTLAAAQRPDTTYSQPFRPQFHFSPRINWTNDPNGLVFHNGEYHLFYQYNPFGNKWGHMTWGHAVSKDLMRWQELPPAIAEDKNGMIFSGSCVVDVNNTSGFGKGGKTPLVAIYTNHREKNQSQHLAWSLDDGRTWTKYDKNPVIDLNMADFRDPSVFWHESSKRWVMSVVLPHEKKALFYGSPNLKDWTKLSEFTAPQGEGIWECPALIEVPVEGQATSKWLLLLSIQSGAPAGGSGMRYFIGDFDGTTFRSDFRPGDVRYVDYGKDYYAAITYNNTPRRISLGWMNNWQYANDIPTSPFRGAMTLPRDLKIIKTDTTYELRQQVIKEFSPLTSHSYQWRGIDTKQLNQSLKQKRIPGDNYVLTVASELDSNLVVKVRQGVGEETLIGYDAASRQVYVDRTKSGQTSFSKNFPGRFSAPLKLRDEGISQPERTMVRLQIYVDRSSVEVFANDGQVTLTNLIFPKPESKGIEFVGGGVRSVTIRNVESTWK